MTNKKNLAIIPARGGSKRLSRKNLRDLNGKPLLAYTIEAAINSKCFSEIILSSEDNEIIKLGKKYPELTIDKRPEILATDTAKALEVVDELFERKNVLKNFDTISLLLPTAPFRTAKDIIGGFNLLTKNDDSIVSIMNYNFAPQMALIMNKESNIVEPVFNPSPLITGQTRSQDFKPMFRPNGGFYIMWSRSFDKHRNYFKGQTK